MDYKIEIVTQRPQLVFGPSAKTNSNKLHSLVAKGLPLPLVGMDRKRRSFAIVFNRVDLIPRCLHNPVVANQTFHVSDDGIPLAELLRRMEKRQGSRKLQVPASALTAGLGFAGKAECVEKLFGDLTVDIKRTKTTHGWKPKVTIKEELARTAKWWRSQARD